MVERTQTVNERLLRRLCVVCGYDGALLRGGRASRCARCGCDLRDRPARSYAEMEGLLGIQLDRPSRVEENRREERLVYRWVAFLFMTMLGLVAMIYLVAAAFTV